MSVSSLALSNSLNSRTNAPDVPSTLPLHDVEMGRPLNGWYYMKKLFVLCGGQHGGAVGNVADSM